MEGQDLRRTHSAGHEGHGVYVCNKCGWPFPNPHPSARHRRAHKRICGTIEGYKLAASEENTHSTVSDDEHSDEDHKTPGPKVLERSNDEKGSVLIGEGSIRSEDGVFSDAAAEFPETGFGAGTREGLEDVREPATNVESASTNDLNAIQALNDGEITETIDPLGNASLNNLMQNSEIPDNTTNQLEYAPEFRGWLSTSDINSVTSSVSNGRTEESAVLLDDTNGSKDNLHPIKYEMVTDASEDYKKGQAPDSVIETSVAQEAEVKGTEATNLDRNLSDVVISPNTVAGERAEGIPKLEGTVEMNLESVRDDEVVPSEKEQSHGFDLYIPQIDLPPEVESFEHVNTAVDAAENKVDTTEGIHYFSSGGLIESFNKNGEGNANVHVISVPDDIHAVENPEAMLEDFKNHKGEKLDQYTFLDSFDQFNDKESDVKNPFLEENFHTFHSSHLSGGTVVSSDMHDLEASPELDEGSSKPMVKEVPVEEEANMSQIKITENQSSVEIAAPADAVLPEIAKSHTVSFPEGNESYDNLNESLQVNFSESATNVLSDANSMIGSSSAGINQTTGLVGLHDNEKAEKDDLGGDHSSKGPAEDNLEVNPITTLPCTKNPTEIQINPAANLHEDDDDAGDYEKGVSEKCNIIGDAGYHEKAEKCTLAGDNHSKGATDEFFAEDPVSNLESASCLSELQVNPVANSHEGGNAGDYEKDKTEMCDIIGNDTDLEKAQKYAVTGDDYSRKSTEKFFAENPIFSLESASSLCEHQVDPATNLHDGDDSVGIKKSVIYANESREGLIEEDLLVKPKLTLDSAIDFNDSKTVAEDARDGSMMELVETKHLDSSSNSSRVGLNVVPETQQPVIENEIDCNEKVQVEVGAGTAAGPDHAGDVELSQKSLENCGMKELGLSSLDAESSVQSFTAAEDNHSREFRGVASGFSSQFLQDESDKNSSRQQLSSSAFDVSVDSYSQTDSLEGNWGSVSVLSMQSDAQALNEAEAVPTTDSQASLEEKPDMKKSKAGSERQYSDKSDMFEAPSFMTLVEPRGGDDKKASEIQTSQNTEQPKSASLQAGWFPSITHVVNESQGRKKNEEIIAKVTNWSTDKQHTPLKSLLGEASLQSKAKSPNQKERLAPVLQKDDKAAKNGGPVATTVNSILKPESPEDQAPKKQNAKEWNSPARYHSEIKREKGKVKGRPYWAQFVCCSSVN